MTPPTIKLYRYTVEYLRDVKEVHNFLYAFSPHHPLNNDADAYHETYPGDDYVDVLGFDAYYDGQSPGWFSGTMQDARLVSKLAAQKHKVAAVTEFGYTMKTTGNQDLNFFTKVLAALQSDPDSKRVAYMLTWANFGTNALYVPYKNAPNGLGDHELLPDFTEFHKDPFTAFRKDVQADQPYQTAPQTKPERPFMHLVTPTSQSILPVNTPTTLRVKVLQGEAKNVTYQVGNDSTPHNMTLDPTTPMRYYTAQWQPDPALNETSTTLTVTVTLKTGETLQSTTPIYIGEGSGETDPLIVDTFERYKGSNSLLDAAYSPAGDPNTITLDEAQKGNGKYGLKFAYTLGSQGYTGEVKNLGGVNWSTTSKLHLWLKPDGSHNNLVLQVNASGIAFEAYPSLAGTTATWLDLPFSSFKVAPWDTNNQGKTLTAELLKDVRAFGVYVNHTDASQAASGTLHLDDITAQP